MRYVFRFTGYGSDGPDQVISREIQQLNSFKRLNEVRQEMGLSLDPTPLGEMILNPSLIPFYQAMMFPPPDQGNGEASQEAKNRNKKNDKEDKKSRRSKRR